MDVPKGEYVKNLLIAVDQLVNALAGNYCDETISSRAYRWSRDGVRHWPCRLIDTLLIFDRYGDKRHCQLSYESEKRRMHMPPELR